MADDAPQLNPNRLTLEQAEKLLSAAGSKLARSGVLREDLEAGAPTNPDGTINLVNYAAWLVEGMGRGA